MLSQTNPLAQRTTSSFPISIGTALALETLFTGSEPVYDQERVIPEHVDINRYQEFWINCNTIYRNILGSVNAADQKALMPGDILETLESELELIKELVGSASSNQVKVIYYVNHYKNLAKQHTHSKLRVDSTPKQMEYSKTRDLVLNEYLKRHKKDMDIKEYDRLLMPSIKCNALILTHDAYDLLSRKNFSDLTLIESHTGKLKDKSLWYTKFSDSKELMRIPFSIEFLQVFGDSQHFFPFPKAAREAIITLANERNWTSVTTHERIIYSLGTLKDKFLSETIKQMSKE